MQPIDIFRNRVGDRLKTASMNASGNGTQVMYDLQYHNVSNLAVVVSGTVLNVTTDYQLDPVNGIVTFTISPADDSDIQFTFNYSAFSDADVTALLAAFGQQGAVLEGLKMLLSDAARLYDYTKGMNQSKRTGVFNNLQALYKLYMTTGVDGTANSVAIGRRHVESDRQKRRGRLIRDFYNGYLGS